MVKGQVTKVNINPTEVDLDLGDIAFDTVNKTMKSVVSSEDIGSLKTFIQQCVTYSQAWITKMDNLTKDFEQQRSENYQAGLGKAKTKNISEQQREMLLKYDIKLDLIGKHLDDGYRFLHKFREVITGEPINYAVIVSDGSALYEVEVDLETLLKRTGGVVKNYSQKDQTTDQKIITSFKRSLRQTTLEQIQEAAGKETILNKKKIGEDSLYSQLNKRREQISSLIGVKNFNKGHIFELEKILKYQYNIKDTASAISSLFDSSSRFTKEEEAIHNYKNKKSFIRYLVKNATNRIADLKGGDQLVKKEVDGTTILSDTQLKNLSNAGAGLIGEFQIAKAMKAIQDAFDGKASVQEAQKKMIEIFSKANEKLKKGSLEQVYDKDVIQKNILQNISLLKLT